MTRTFRIFFTIKRLLSFAINDHILSDATYKILIEGFPILTVCTTDKCKVFHPFGFAVVSSETDFSFYFSAFKKSIKESNETIYKQTKLIVDNAAAIHNGFIACQYFMLICNIISLIGYFLFYEWVFIAIRVRI